MVNRRMPNGTYAVVGCRSKPAPYLIIEPVRSPKGRPEIIKGSSHDQQSMSFDFTWHRG
jgi:hypothetical protein